MIKESNDPYNFNETDGLKKMREEANNNNKILTEGLLTPYNASEILDYIVNNSENVAVLAESFGFDIDNSNLSVGKDQMLSIKNNNDILKVYLESTIKHDLDDFFSSIV